MRPRFLVPAFALCAPLTSLATPTPAANTPPSASEPSLDCDEDTSATANLEARDIDNDPLVFRLVKPPKNGDAALGANGHLTYTPKQDFHGKDELTYEVADGKAKTLGKVRISVSSVNDKPTVTVSVGKGTEDKPVSGQLVARDVDGDPLLFSVAREPTIDQGALLVDRTGRFTFTPAPDVSGAIDLLLRVSDGTVDIDVPVQVVLDPVNDPPTTRDETFQTTEDVAARGTLPGADADKDPLTFTVVARPAKGNLVVDSRTGAFTYTPPRDYAGEEAFTFTVSDGKSSAKAKATIVVQNVNDPPTVSPLALEGSEDTELRGKVVAQDFDGDQVYFTIKGEPKKGDAEIDASTGAVTYTPKPNFNGTDSFVVEASDIGGGVTTTVNVTVKPVNDAPVAREGYGRGDEDKPITGAARADDADKDPLRFSLVKAPRSGALDLRADGTWTYTPNADFHGDDVFLFEAADATSRGEGKVELAVKPVNDAPKTSDVSVATREDEPVAGRVVGTDIDKDALSYSLGRGPKLGTAEVDDRNGAFTYTPNRDENGEDSFTVVVSDGPLQAEATVRVKLAPVNDGPVARAFSKSGDEDHPIEGDAPATDVDRDPLTWKLVTRPRLGAVTLDERTGAFRFTPNANANGDDGFRFEVNDGKLKSTADVKLTVVAVNDAPDIKTLSLTTSEEKPVAGAVTASDVDKDKLTFTLGVPPKKGDAAVDAASGRVSYAPRLNENGEDTFVVEVGDGKTKSSALVTIGITPVNDSPVADAHAAPGPEDQAIQGQLVARDVDGDRLSFKALSQPRRGAVQVDPVTGAYTYTPRPNENGEDAFRFEVTDGALRASADVKLTLTPVNDTPEPKSLALATNEDKEVSGRVDAFDVDRDVLTFRVKTAPAHGVATVDDATGAIRFVPARDYAGSDGFVVEVTDGLATADSAVSVTLAPTPDAPVVDPRPLATHEDEPVSLRLTAVDADGEPTSWKVVGAPRLGTAQLEPDGVTLRYVPRPNEHGEDLVVVEASDAKNRVRASLPVLVAAKNDEPTIDPATVDTLEEVAALIPLQVHDVDGDAVTLALAPDAPKSAVLDGSLLRVTPPRDFAGSIVVSVVPRDASGAGPAQKITVNVANVNDTPVVRDRTLQATAGKPASGVVEASDADAGDSLTVTVAVPPRLGTVTVDDPRTGSFTYVPSADARGVDSFRLRVKDAAGASVTATVKVTVTGAAPPKS